MRNYTERNDSEIEKVLDNTTTDVHVGQSAAKSQGHFRYVLSIQFYVRGVDLHNRNTSFDNQ